MWIHVPSIPFPSVPGTEELSLGSERLSQLESSAMWKSKFQQQKSWQNVWKKRPSMRRLSGLISEPSTLNRGVEKWICSLEGSLVSRSVLQERNSEKTTSETSGPTQPDLLGGLGFQSSFLKMCPESSDTTGKPYDPNYERWVTRLRRDSSQRPRLGPLTRGNDSLFWPTAQNKDYKRENLPAWEARQQRKAEEGINLQQNLCIATLKNWPTPRARDDFGPQREMIDGQCISPDGQRWGLDLPMAATNWPTPTGTERSGTNPNTGKGEGLNKTAKNWPTSNTRDPRRGCNQRQLATEVDKWPIPNASEHKYRMQGNSQQSNGLTATARKSLIHSIHQDQETGTDGTGSSENTQTLHQPSAKKDTMCSPKCRRLNPAFAEHLMGLPPGWTSVSEPLEMGLYRQWQHSLSELLREN